MLGTNCTFLYNYLSLNVSLIFDVSPPLHLPLGNINVLKSIRSKTQLMETWGNLRHDSKWHPASLSHWWPGSRNPDRGHRGKWDKIEYVRLFRECLYFLKALYRKWWLPTLFLWSKRRGPWGKCLFYFIYRELKELHGCR